MVRGTRGIYTGVTTAGCGSSFPWHRFSMQPDDEPCAAAATHKYLAKSNLHTHTYLLPAYNLLTYIESKYSCSDRIG